MLRRLHPEQPESFSFTPDNHAWAEAQISKYPAGRQASAVIPLLWRAQEQEGWLSRPAIEEIGRMLDMAYIRVLEVATFYFMFQLQPVGSLAHVQVCGTTSCMICGAEDLIAVCREKIAPKAHQLSGDGRFSWEEVECLGACANAPMVQIGKDYYEDLTTESFGALLDRFAAGEVPLPGPQSGRFAAEPAGGATSLVPEEGESAAHNASVTLARDIGDTIRRIDGTEVPLLTPWRKGNTADAQPPRNRDDLMPPSSPAQAPTPGPRSSEGKPADETGVTEQAAEAVEMGRPKNGQAAQSAPHVSEPARLGAPREGRPDDLQRITGIDAGIEGLLHEMGIYHYEQIAEWGPAEIAWVDAHLEGAGGRASRDDWTGQAQALRDGQTES
ncbi:NADH-quinone oxidoreductase subunit E [Profundibacterium mesophilum]|uniref:NADH dehydrogenase-ubiquinone oxidoreductase chain E n=1 Tax=Profundibacterium mesophilum KAUST100406-0324 TaxID=1037889 RepID=A0A921NSX1_9RHOB|nr:NADH-quinone oxidoreductase subunit E [Profundibacterium mesophilum]KAF0674868.1 NADH dehydrogenase-ubiquinone oxidoreductase chain E [Profundibacterium mesophilum KAUST100406-0324]